jgi:hypothetical protein
MFEVEEFEDAQNFNGGLASFDDSAGSPEQQGTAV